MSPHKHKLSLFAAILININIMLGSGIFINSTVLAKQAGIFGALSYLIVGILMLPLIISMSTLVGIHPTGGVYTFGKEELSPFVMFVSTWSYIIGKLGSAAIVTQISVLLLQQTFPWLSNFNSLYLNGGIMAAFIALNMLDIRTSKTIQSSFLGLKLIPILFGIFISLYLFSPSNVVPQYDVLANIPVTLPLVVFAITGFEAACSLSRKIHDASTNAPRVILISYGIVIATLSIFQFMIYGALGSMLAALPDYRFLFPSLVQGIIPTSQALQVNLVRMFHLAIAASALGGSYGILFSNTWNIYTLAQHKHFFGSRAFTQYNRYAIPWLCVILEGAIYLLYLVVSRGSQIPLQQIGALGSTITYTLSALSLWVAVNKRNDITIARWIPKLAFGNCLILMGATLYSFLTKGMSSLIVFGSLFAFGCLMFWLTRNQALSHLDRQERQQT